MDIAEYLRVLRGRWLVVAAAVLVSLSAAWVTSTVAPIATGSPTYTATALLVGPPSPNALNLSTVAALATIEPVAERVADDLGFEGDHLLLAARIGATADTTSGTLAIRATSSVPREAERLADSFARELIGYLTDRNAESATAQIETVQEQLEELDAEIAELDQRIANTFGTSADVLRAQRDAKILQYGTLSQQYQAALSTLGQPVGIDIVQDASARETAVGGLQAPRSRMARLIIAAILGLLFGVGIALLLERMHPKIRTRDAAAKQYGVPVIGEIPRVPRRERDELVTAARPRSATANAFRLLVASLSRRPSPGGSRGHASAKAILVTSPGPGEGKTTVVANLAVAFAEIGRSVLILSCDFTRPGVHRVFGVRNVPGLAEGLADMNGKPILNDCIQVTPMQDIRLVGSGNRPDNPGELLSSGAMRSAVKEARRLADVVLLDTAPLLAEADAAHLLSEVDAVLVVLREGQTSVDFARRGSDILERLAAPLAGVILNDATQATMPGYYAQPRNSDVPGSGIRTAEAPDRDVRVEDSEVRPEDENRRGGNP